MTDDATPATGLIYTGSPGLKEPIVAALRTVYDPEIPVDIFELGLVYKVDVAEDGRARVEMTLTSPACPAAEQIPEEVRDKVAAVDGVESANVDIVWEPAWTPEFMSDAAKVQLGMY